MGMFSLLSQITGSIGMLKEYFKKTENEDEEIRFIRKDLENSFENCVELGRRIKGIK